MLVGLSLTLSIPTVLADTVQVSYAPWVVQKAAPTSLSDITTLIRDSSAFWGVSYDQMLNTLDCESKLDPNAIGDYGTSFGISQIHLPAHPEISKAQALDPHWAIEYMAKNISTGHASFWSCSRILGYSK